AIADEEDFPVFRGSGQEVDDLAPRPVQCWTGIVGGKNQAKRPCLASPCRDALLHASTPPSSAACRVPLDQSSYTKRAQCCVYPIPPRYVKTHRKWRRRDVMRWGNVDKLAKGICLIRIVCSLVRRDLQLHGEQGRQFWWRSWGQAPVSRLDHN